MMRLSFPFALVLCAASAAAESRSATLLGDAPRLALAATPRLLDPALGAAEVKSTPAAVAGIGFGEHFGKTAAIGMAATTTGVLLGAGLGMLSNNLLGAAIPGLLLANLIFTPVITVLMAMVIGNWDSPGRFGFWLPLAGAFGVNAAAILIVSLAFQFAVPWTNPAALLLYSLIDGLLMSGASVGLMHLTEKKPAPSTVTSFVPGVTDTTLVPLVKVNL